MRSIGELENPLIAQRFCDYLLTKGIEASCEAAGADPDGSHDIWVRDEEQLAQSQQLLTAFRANPGDAIYANVAKQAQEVRENVVAENRRKRSFQQRVKYKSARDIGGASGGGVGKIPLTIGFIVVCVLVAIATNRGSAAPTDAAGNPTFGYQLKDTFSFVSWPLYNATQGDPLASIRKGEVWRLITPVFVHLGILHLLFNMYWMYNLGGTLERLQGWGFLLILLLFSAVIGCLVQGLAPKFLVGSPFGFGASGVVYGLFGYLWIRPLMDTSYSFRLNQGTIYLMIAWLFICMTGYVGNIANGGHVGGLLAGMAFAAIVVQFKRK